MQYWTCPLCGANLDRNERCDCRDEKRNLETFFEQHIKVNKNTGQLAFMFDGSREKNLQTGGGSIE